LNGSYLGQRLSWLIAALLVVLGSGLVAVWLSGTAARADRDTLARGADAIQSNVEEQLRLLELAGLGTKSFVGEDIEGVDLDVLVNQIDFTVLSSLLGVISFPVDENGISTGEFLLLGVIGRPSFDAPDLVLDRAKIVELAESGGIYLSEPLVTSAPDRLDYVFAVAIEMEDEGLQVVGVAFRPDRMVASALEAVGEGQYAVDAVDVRFGNELVLSMGQPASSLEEVRFPAGVEKSFALVVHPGSEFPFVQSSWIVVLVLVTGVVIALLLVLMGRMAESRSEGLAERLRFAQELSESKDRFLATVSHELRTPLTVVLGIASEMGSRWDRFDEAERTDLMSMMAEQAVEAANIVEDLLVAARSDPSRLRLAMEHTHLKPHVEYAVGSLSDDGQKRVVSHAPDLPVYADTTRLRQILRNLLENAVRHGGQQITVDATCGGNQLTVVVADDGNLAESDIERIFEPYEQSDGLITEALPGVGIGLFVSRLLARLMGGDLDCVRDEGWTKFRLTLPSAADDADAEPEMVSAFS
jgi:signal transduction histidine kinase